MLKLQIDGAWEAQDFIEVLQAVESLYYKVAHQNRWMSFRHPLHLEDFLFVDEMRRESSFGDRLTWINGRLLEQARYTVPGESRLKINRIQYASPGGIDFVGIGKACEAVERVVGRIITYFDESKLREERDKQAALDTQIKEIAVDKERESLRALQIKNAEDILRLTKEYPEGRAILVPLAVRDQEILTERIAVGKLIGVRTSGDE